MDGNKQLYYILNSLFKNYIGNPKVDVVLGIGCYKVKLKYIMPVKRVKTD